MIDSFLAGPRAQRNAQRVVAGILSVVAVFAGAPGVSGSGRCSPTPPGGATVAFGPEEKSAYVVDTYTDHVTRVDVESGQRVTDIGTGRGLKGVISLAEGRRVAAVSDERIDLINTALDKIISSIPMNDGVHVVTSSDGNHVVVYGPERIVVLDAKSGSVLGNIDEVKSPDQILFGR